MPFAITAGTAATVPVVTQTPVTLDKANMTFMSIDFRRAGKPSVTIAWDLGYNDAAGVFVAAESKEITVTDPATVGGFLTNLVTNGNTYLQEFEDGVFSYLQQVGAIGAGVIEVAV